MIPTKYTIKYTSQFKKDYGKIKKRHWKLSLLKEIVAKLANGLPLATSNRDHELGGNWVGYRECHITSDWLLIYRIDDNVLVLTLTKTGTHSDIFG